MLPCSWNIVWYGINYKTNELERVRNLDSAPELKTVVDSRGRKWQELTIKESLVQEWKQRHSGPLGPDN